MSCSQGSRTNLAIAVQPSFAVKPADPVMQLIPITTHNLDLSKERVQGSDLLGDTIPRHDRHGTRKAGGQIVADLRKGDYDILLESLFMSSFANDILKIGTTQKYLMIEDRANDIDQFRLFTGLVAASMSLSIAPDASVQTTFEMVGRDMEQNQTTASTGGSPTGPTNNEPFDTFSTLLDEDGDPLGIVTSLELSINRNISPAFVVGSKVAHCLEFGRADVTGKMTVRYKDETLINKFLNEEEMSLEFTLNDSTLDNGYTFTMPRIKYNGASAPVTSPLGRFVTIPFVALRDTASATNVQVTRQAPTPPPNGD